MSKPLFSNLARKKLNFWRFRFSVKTLNLTASFHKLLKLHFLLSFTRNILVTSLLTHNTCIQDFGDLKLVTDLEILGGAESKIRFCPSGQD